MAGKNTAAFGIFRSRAAAEQSVDALLAAGFRNDDVSVLAPDQAVTRELATEKNTKAPEGAATGAATGGAIGGTLGLLAGIGALAIPGIGPLIAAGPIVGALAGAGAGAAAGGLVGALVGMGIPEYEAKRYEGRVKEGGILVSVHCDDSDWVSRAKDVLERNGAEDISSAGEKSVSSHGVDDSSIRRVPTVDRKTY
jgi:Heat induced stress protein YflT domain